MVHGTGGSTLDLRYVPTYADVMHGDRVVTSGVDRIFPRGLGLGTVAAISRSADGIQTIVLDPALDLASLEEVLVVLERAPEIEEPQ
jgi:rod shape-determining protein MreC